MRRFVNLCTVVLAILLLASCTSQKNLIYFQNDDLKSDNQPDTMLYKYENGYTNSSPEYKLQPHDMIYVLISGTYTPYMLVSLRPYNVWNLGTSVVAYVMLGFVWVCCIIGAVFNSINIHKYRHLSMTCYIISGWVVVTALFVLWNIITPWGVLLLLFGGIVYTIGAVLYAIGKKKKYFHSLFHFFVLAGAVLMFISVYCFVL